MRNNNTSSQGKQPPHILVIASEAQGHLNPTFQLAKRLARAGSTVTYATSGFGHSRINLSSNLDRLSITTFSNGYDPDNDPSEDRRARVERAKRVGCTSLHNLITSLGDDQGQPITLLIYTLMLPWAAEVARDLHVPSAFFCIQSATSFAVYTSYFNELNGNNNKSPPSCIQLPGLPLFESGDLPCFLLPSSPIHYVVPIFEEHITTLQMDPNPTVLVNSFDALDEHAIRAVDGHQGVKVINIGPLVPSAFSDMSDPSDTSYGCDLFGSSEVDHLSWLETKGDKSVVYVSFGTLSVLKKKMFEEFFHGLIQTGRPFLWVVRPTKDNNKVVGQEDGLEISDIINGFGTSDKGLFVAWCPQLEVLHHRAIGCHVTHCGWNSILESLVMGVPIVGVPQMYDQPTNAKMVDEVWRVGIKARKNEERNVDRKEVTRCVEDVMGNGEVGVEIRNNSIKWKEMALAAVLEGGSSNSSFDSFLKNLQEMKINP